MRLISSEPAKIDASGKFTQESVIEYTEDITEIVPAEPHPRLDRGDATTGTFAGTRCLVLGSRLGAMIQPREHRGMVGR